MRNKCRHGKAVLIVDHDDLRWWWCERCGATRMGTRRTNFVDYTDRIMTQYNYGKWKSPEVARK